MTGEMSRDEVTTAICFPNVSDVVNAAEETTE